jgi:hypothetical protein
MAIEGDGRNEGATGPGWREAPAAALPGVDPEAPVSGHRPAGPTDVASPSAAPEHDWAAASGQVFPALRPAGTHGMRLADVEPAQLAQEGMKKHASPVIDEGPADLAIVYVLRQPSFDVVVNADHLLTWAVEPERLRETAMANLRAWSASAPWTDEVAGERHILSSDTGDGADAARILLPEVRSHLAGECGGPARVLVAMPDRDLLLAGSLALGDTEFAGQFAAFVGDIADGAHEPIDRRVFELVGDELVPFAG